MDTIALLGSALGLGFLAGIRLYATALTVGLAIRFGLLHLNQRFGALDILADWRVLTIAGIAFFAEFLADKVPWVDSAWDAVHTFIRPVGATLLAAAALGDMDPVARTALALLTGGVALTAHSGKAATRAIVNHSPEPVSNMVLSLSEDALIPAGVWLATAHPLVTLVLVIVAVVLTVVFVRLAVGALRRTFRALSSVFSPYTGRYTPRTPRSR